MENEMYRDDFCFLEAEILEQECENCGHLLNNDSEEYTECPECGSESLLNSTTNEGQECEICGKEFDVWEDVYEYQEGEDILICEYCYCDLEG